MSRQAPWRNDLHPIRERVTRSKLEYWRREDLEDLFRIKREAARNIMLATAQIANLGGVYVVSRYALLELIDKLVAGDNPCRVLADLLDQAPAAPAAKPIRVPIPEQFKTVSLHELPSNIIMEEGRLEIRGDGVGILQSIALLARALEGELDLAQFCAVCNRTSETDKRLLGLLTELRQRFRPDGSVVEPVTTTDLAPLEVGEERAVFLIGCPWEHASEQHRQT
jgi:hypothetical protein